MSTKFSTQFISKNPLLQEKPKSLEHKAEEFLGFPQEKARERTDNYLGIKPDIEGVRKAQNSFEYGDTARHFIAGDQTSRSIQDKLGFIGKTFPGKALSIIGSNVGGLIHEAQNIKDGRPVLESVEDATNNFVGSIGSLFSKKNSAKVLDKLKKYLPDGKVKN